VPPIWTVQLYVFIFHLFTHVCNRVECLLKLCYLPVHPCMWNKEEWLNWFWLNLILENFMKFFSCHLHQTMLTTTLHKSITTFLSLFNYILFHYILYWLAAHNCTISILASHCCNIKNSNVSPFFFLGRLE
jgi:hypothetical protein